MNVKLGTNAVVWFLQTPLNHCSLCTGFVHFEFVWSVSCVPEIILLCFSWSCFKWISHESYAGIYVQLSERSSLWWPSAYMYCKFKGIILYSVSKGLTVLLELQECLSVDIFVVFHKSFVHPTKHCPVCLLCTHWLMLVVVGAGCCPVVLYHNWTFHGLVIYHCRNITAFEMHGAACCAPPTSGT